MHFLSRFKGLSSKIYVAFLITAVVPVCIAGLVGIFYSLNALKNETLHHLDQEVAGRSDGMARFFDQLSSELLYLASSSSLRELAATAGSFDLPSPRQARLRLKRDFTAFAKTYPYIYQIRYLNGQGKEVIRVDRRGDQVYVVPDPELQDKSDRYYVQETLARNPGEIYISPLDLNVERGQAELPEKPVVRFGTPITDSTGVNRGLLIINLHAEVILGQIQQMAGARSGAAYLFNRSGFYLARSAETSTAVQSFEMKSLEALTATYPREMLARILGGARGTEVVGEWIVAYAPVAIRSAAEANKGTAMEWAIVLALPKNRLFAAVFNLYILYGVLAVSLLATAVAGFVLSRHLLRPLTLLREETEEIARGNLSSRIEINGTDEIADLGARFNLMASKLEQSYQSLENQKQHLEQVVRARTAALERERQNLATVIENTADGILSLSSEGAIDLANAAAGKLLAGDGESLVGRHIRDYWPTWDTYLESDVPPSFAARRFDLPILGKTLSLNVAPLARNGAYHGYIIVMRDVSEERGLQDDRRELDRQIFQMEKMTAMGELAMGLAHEIGNPLAGMKTVAQALLEERDLTDHVRLYLGRIENEVDRLSAFLRTFHGFAAPQEMHPAPCRLEEVLEDVLLWTRKEAKSVGINIAYQQCSGMIPELWADPNQLKQLLLNLVINAIHATGKGGDITIGMCGPVAADDPQGAGPRVRFCVEDNGAGIAPEILPRIFDPFFTTRESGSGLGLAVVKKIAVQHGADIFVDSRPGEGTRFQLVWPVAPPKDEQCLSFAQQAEPACRKIRKYG